MLRHDGIMPTVRQQDWTPVEADRLLQLAKRRTSAARAAKLLGRRVASVRRQAKALGILLYKK